MYEKMEPGFLVFHVIIKSKKSKRSGFYIKSSPNATGAYRMTQEKSTELCSTNNLC